jgi:hypothetical protein
MRWARRAMPELSLSPILVAQVGDVGGVANAGGTSHEAVTLITRSCNGRNARGTGPNCRLIERVSAGLCYKRAAGALVIGQQEPAAAVGPPSRLAA